ncbi:hypothetical protein [Burkholderia cenocepacia]|uniref:hypothetical protein n=1 Tax=Burkholderia cenocepacia TaxID=95486 RepID=UPI0015C3DB3D|nr:hypothetical protein [Burkholderia cenocepacia]
MTDLALAEHQAVVVEHNHKYQAFVVGMGVYGSSCDENLLTPSKATFGFPVAERSQVRQPYRAAGARP